MTARSEETQLFEVRALDARPQIREILIAQKLRRWCLIAKYKFVDPSCPPARARRNFWRLAAKHPEIMMKLGLNLLSVYEPF